MAMMSGGPKTIMSTAVGLGTMVLAPIAAVVLIGASKPVARYGDQGGRSGRYIRQDSGGRRCNGFQGPGGERPRPNSMQKARKKESDFLYTEERHLSDPD